MSILPINWEIWAKIVEKSSFVCLTNVVKMFTVSPVIEPPNLPIFGFTRQAALLLHEADDDIVIWLKSTASTGLAK